MFSGCCCSAAKDPGQLSFRPSAGDEHVAAASDMRVPASAEKRAVQSAPAGAPRAPEILTGSARSMSMTEEEKDEEKSRIQEMVNRFAKGALVGCPCICIREGSGERVATKYRINKSLEYLVILSVRDVERAEITCPIADVQDIYSYVEDGESCFPPAVIAALGPQELELLLMVVYHSDGDRVLRFCLMERCIESRDTFLECLRILCIYAASARNRRAPP